MITDQYSSAEESDEEIEKRSDEEYVEYLKKTFSLGDFMEWSSVGVFSSCDPSAFSP